MIASPTGKDNGHNAAMTFTGFGSEASGFLGALEKDNSRQFCEAHRQKYDDAVRQPLEDVLREAEITYGPGRVMRHSPRFPSPLRRRRSETPGRSLTRSSSGATPTSGPPSPSHDNQPSSRRSDLDAAPGRNELLSRVRSPRVEIGVDVRSTIKTDTNGQVSVRPDEDKGGGVDSLCPVGFSVEVDEDAPLLGTGRERCRW